MKTLSEELPSATTVTPTLAESWSMSDRAGRAGHSAAARSVARHGNFAVQSRNALRQHGNLAGFDGEARIHVGGHLLQPVS